MKKLTCTKCGVTKEHTLANFNRRKNAFGWYMQCKPCRSYVSRMVHRKNYSVEKQHAKDVKKKSLGKQLEASRLSQSRYPEKHRARYLLRNAVKRGDVTKSPCKVCGEVRVEAHHHDYSKPYEVEWLCKKHHMEKHRKPDSLLSEPQI